MVGKINALGAISNSITFLCLNFIMNQIQYLIVIKIRIIEIMNHNHYKIQLKFKEILRSIRKL